MPAARTFWILGAISLLLTMSLVEPDVVLVAVALDVAVFLAFLLDLARARRTELSAERTWPAMLFQRAACRISVELSTRAARRLTVRLREGLDPAIHCSPLRHEMRIPASGRAVWEYGVVPRHRGEPRLAPLTARLLGPWGLAWSQRDLLPTEVRRVYPQVRWEGRVGRLLAMAQRHQLGAMPLRLRGTGAEPYALRHYLPGDPPNRIHWKATARHDQLVTREDTWERGARLVVMLDTARAMTGREDDLGKLDYSLAAALALTRVATARGDRVTIVAFSDRIERVLRVSSGAAGLSRAYARFFNLSAKFTEPAYDLAAEYVFGLETRSATVVLFTSVVDLAAAELLQGALLRLERRHRPMLVNLQDPTIHSLAGGTPDSEVEAFAQVTCLEIQLANRRLSRRLRRAGIRVVDTPADRLALETLEAYLSLFRSGLRGRRSAPRAGAMG